MPPKKKKQPRNAFYFFMLDWKAQKERQGQRFKDLKEVSELCSDEWKVINERDLKKYKLMENAAKGKDKSDLSNKYNSLGVTFRELENQKLEVESAMRRMHSDVDKLLDTDSRDRLMKQHFYLVHTNVYCYWGQEQVYIPCEVAISKFNLKDGVVDTFHVFPAPYTKNADIPLGYKYQVQQNSLLVHEIPEPSEFDQLEHDWKKIRSDIHHFLRADGPEIPPLFTMDMDDSNTNCYITAVKNFFDLVTGDTSDDFRVYSLTLLFFKLYEVCQQVARKEFHDYETAFPVEGVAHQQLLRDIYNFSPGIACKFHETTDHYHNCSLSYVKRWVFLICEFCCAALRIELIPGSHCLVTAKIILPWNEVPPKHQPQPTHSTSAANSSSVARASNIAANAHHSQSRNSSHSSEEDDDDNGAYCTVPKVQHQMRSLQLEGQKVGSSSGGAWGTAPKVQQGWLNRKVENRKEDDEDLVIDTTKVPDPSQRRVFRTGQSPNVVSEIMPGSAPPSVRLPTTRGRGESLARALGEQQSAGAAFLPEDFPAIGASKPGRLAKPLAAAGWGRGFLKQ